MPFLAVEPGVELHYYDDDFTDPWRSAPTMLLQHGFSRIREVLVQLGTLVVPRIPCPASRHEGNGQVGNRRGTV